MKEKEKENGKENEKRGRNNKQKRYLNHDFLMLSVSAKINREWGCFMSIVFMTNNTLNKIENNIRSD